MKAYEFPAKIGPEGSVTLPESLAKSLSEQETVRVIILVNEASDDEEDAEWSRFASSQLLAQYDEADAIYDTI